MKDADENQLDALQKKYTDALKQWTDAIEAERALVEVSSHSLAEVDHWEEAHFQEEENRAAVKEAKQRYEDALREKFFGF